VTIFLRVLSEKKDKLSALKSMTSSVRLGEENKDVFEKDSLTFSQIPGSPFAYWASKGVLNTFKKFNQVESGNVIVRVSNETGDDSRFLRLWFEIPERQISKQYRWLPHAKGGTQSNYYCDLPLMISWNNRKGTVHGYTGRPARPDEVVANASCFFRPGLTYPRRTNGFSVRVMPDGSIFGNKGPAILENSDDAETLLALCAMLNSHPFKYLISVQLARTDLAQSFEVGLVQQTPMPELTSPQQRNLAALAHQAWSLTRELDSSEETSHAFILPAILGCKPSHLSSINAALAKIKKEINEIALGLYGFEEQDITPILEHFAFDYGDLPRDVEDCDDDGGDTKASIADDNFALLSWCIGVAFGRFDWRLATGERDIPPEPDPFDPLPAKSPGMLTSGAIPFHSHSGILVDDPGHLHDLPRLVEDVLAAVDYPTPEDVRRWLRRDFFPNHLRQYSKSRRKAPIYWPLSTASSGYTLWLYYPTLTDQTLYTAANDFVGPKLEEMSRRATALRTSSSRSRDEERHLEQLQDLEAELRELQDELLRLAPTWKPNHDDGVQITAAPLWRLFRYRPWQTVLKETWEKLEKSEYDWAHLAMSYWPDRVREKCLNDKSLAIAHDLEDLYDPPPEKSGAGRRGRKRAMEAV
jgi:hypothetical protein